jgi:hypothetical protein
LQICAQLDLVQAEKALLGVHEAVVMHHCGHGATGKCVTVEQGDSRHRVGYDSAPERIERAIEEIGRADCAFEVKAIAVESVFEGSLVRSVYR